MAKTRTTKSGAARRMRVLLLTTTEGEIIGGALPSSPGGPRVLATIRPLVGQAVHEVELSGAVFRGKSAEELYRILSCYRVEPGRGRLVALPGHPQAQGHRDRAKKVRTRSRTS